MKLTIQKQLALSAQLAALTGWRKISYVNGSYMGERPRQMGRHFVPNYFDHEATAAKAELLAWVEGQSLNYRTHFLQLLDANRTGGAWFDAINYGAALTVTQALAVLTAPPAVVAECLVEVFALDQMAVAA